VLRGILGAGVALWAQSSAGRELVNAADLYKQAYALYGQLSANEKDMLTIWRDREPTKPPPEITDPDAARALYGKIQPIMELLRRARRADYLEWGTNTRMDPPHPPAMDLTSLEKKYLEEYLVHTLKEMVIREAGYRFHRDPDGAVGDLAALVAMGRNGSDSRGVLYLAYSIHSDSVELIAKNLGRLTNASGPDLAEITSTATIKQMFEGAMKGEAQALKRELAVYANEATRGDSSIPEWAKEKSVTPEEVVSELKWAIETEQEAGTMLLATDKEFQIWLHEKRAEAASKLVTDANLGLLETDRAVAFSCLTEDALLQAGMALARKDQPGFRSVINPINSKPFQYKRTADGFELSTENQRFGRPAAIEMSFSTDTAK
jgi:hypothetical protein